MTNAKTLVPVDFVDGSQRWVRPALAADVVGLDVDGDLLVSFLGSFTPLTPCCHASGTGSPTPTGVACRSCYRTVKPKFGSTVRLAAARKS